MQLGDLMSCADVMRCSQPYRPYGEQESFGRDFVRDGYGGSNRIGTAAAGIRCWSPNMLECTVRVHRKGGDRSATIARHELLLSSKRLRPGEEATAWRHGVEAAPTSRHAGTAVADTVRCSTKQRTVAGYVLQKCLSSMATDILLL